MFCFLETGIRQQKKFEIKTKTSLNNTVNDLHYEIKFENCVKDKNIIFIMQNVAFLFWTKIYFILGDIFFKIPKYFSNTSASFFFFLPRQIVKKNRYASAKASNAALVKLSDWIIKNDHVIKCAMYFCKWFKHGQASDVIWLSITWLLIFRLEVSNKRPLFTTNPASIYMNWNFLLKRYNFLQLQNFVYTPPHVATQGKGSLLMRQK